MRESEEVFSGREHSQIYVGKDLSGNTKKADLVSGGRWEAGAPQASVGAPRGNREAK